MFTRHKPEYYQVAQGVWGLKILFVNVFMISLRNGSQTEWVLVDAGLKGSAGRIIKMAESLFGKRTQPKAIILTHGHFDHVGALEDLLEVWDVPVYAHPLEAPYLTGRSSYPPGDPTVGGGMMSLMAWTYPTKPINIGSRLKTLHDGERIEFMPEWRAIHTPGHSPGHISLFRELNATLIAGDAFITTKNESAFCALTFLKQISGPPKYFTTDWDLAENSVRKLAALRPRIAATGHGKPMMGKELRNAISYLVANFKEVGVPSGGRYVGHPAIADERGVEYVPPFRMRPKFAATIFLGAAVASFLLVKSLSSGNQQQVSS
ncbi:MAG: fold metallo-hydrolase [Sphingobacteriaceae bacterium]|jgi:glyoxylase-like metal-dependent hydrolase (beta-lactamase superfamily II)|nr:fold metallo-hydrolase [Sphingobacteriaceae bacterium]